VTALPRPADLTDAQWVTLAGVLDLAPLYDMHAAEYLELLTLPPGDRAVIMRHVGTAVAERALST